MHVAAEAKPQTAMKTMKTMKAMKAMKAIKGDKGNVWFLFHMHVPAGDQAHEGHEDSCQASCQDQEPGLVFHVFSFTLGWCFLHVVFLFYLHNVSAQALPGPPEVAKDWVRCPVCTHVSPCVLWNDPMMSTLMSFFGFLSFCMAGVAMWPMAGSEMPGVQPVLGLVAEDFP